MNLTLHLIDLWLRGGLQAGTKDRQILADQVLNQGLQRMLLYFVNIFHAGLATGTTVPGGFSGRLLKALGKPNVGGLLDYLLWLSAQIKHPALAPLASYLQKVETKPTGWLSQLKDLRNKRAGHGEAFSEEDLQRCSHLLANPPDFSTIGGFQVDGETVAWSTTGSILPLDPFVFFLGGYLQTVVELTSGFDPVFSIENQKRRESMKAHLTWFRLLDQALENPTPEDIYTKAARIPLTGTAEAPWWIDHLFVGNAGARLVSEEVMEGLMFSLREKYPRTALVPLELQADEMPSPAMARTLGLAIPPSINDIISFAVAEHPLVLSVRTKLIDHRTFLKLLSWVVDLGGCGHLRILVERDESQLQIDQQKLWDRLPEGLEGCLARPRKSGSASLTDYLWKDLKKRKVLGLF